MTVIANSTFLDAFGDKEATAQQFAALTSSSSLAIAQAVLGQLYAENGVPASVSVAPSADMITVGLVLNRANDPTALLESSWGVREAALANQSAVFATYGALPTTFGATLAATEAAIGPGGAAVLPGGVRCRLHFLGRGPHHLADAERDAVQQSLRHPASQRRRPHAARQLHPARLGRRPQPRSRDRRQCRRPVVRERSVDHQSGGPRFARRHAAGWPAGHRQFEHQRRQRHARGDRRQL